MKVSGVITEYNPFHNGHKYQLDKIREETHADYIIVAMSGDFMQRGTPAFIDKYTRAEMALRSGADLVLEIPTIGATASAEGFALAGVKTLAAAGVVSALCYGVEKKSRLLTELADFLVCPAQEYKAALSSHIKSGDSFPAARAKAVCACFPAASVDELQKLLATPNNILAVEYEKAMKATNMTGHQIERVGEGYHSARLNDNFVSASGIRHAVETGCLSHEIQRYMPQEAFEVLISRAVSLTGSDRNIVSIRPDDISQLLLYRLLSVSSQGGSDAFCSFSDCTTELSAKICSNLYSYKSFTQFCDLLKSKNYTHTRISRVLLHILLGITESDTAALMQSQTAPYLRVLGFKSSSSALLHEIKEKASAPLITKVADAASILIPSSYEVLKKDIYASDLYRSLLSGNIHVSDNMAFNNMPNEYTKRLLIVP